VTHDAQQIGVVNDTPGYCHAHIRVSLVVLGGELKLEAELLEAGLGILDGHLSALLDSGAQA